MAFRLAILLSAVLAIPASAQDKPKPIAAHAKVDQEKVDDAIKKGCKYLLQSGQGMGTFPHGQRNQPQAIQAYFCGTKTMIPRHAPGTWPTQPQAR